MSDRDGNPEIYVMNADGSGQVRMTEDPADDSQPVWSPDGREIAFVSERDGNREIYVMNASTGGHRRLTFNEFDDWDPDWQTIPSADVGVQITAAKKKATPNRPVTFTVAVTNLGPSKADGVVVSAELAPASELLSVSASQGTCSPPSVGAGGTLTCDLGAVPSGTTSLIHVSVKATTRRADLTTRATVTAETPDPATTNNQTILAMTGN